MSWKVNKLRRRHYGKFPNENNNNKTISLNWHLNSINLSIWIEHRVNEWLTCCFTVSIVMVVVTFVVVGKIFPSNSIGMEWGTSHSQSSARSDRFQIAILINLERRAEPMWILSSGLVMMMNRFEAFRIRVIHSLHSKQLADVCSCKLLVLVSILFLCWNSNYICYGWLPRQLNTCVESLLIVKIITLCAGSSFFVSYLFISYENRY